MNELIPIAFCITELDKGGAELALCDLVTRLDRGRFEPVVYCMQPRPCNETASCVGIIEKADIPIHFLNVRSLSSAFAGFAKFRKLLKEQKPLILQTFLFHANIFGRLAAYSAGVPHCVSGIRVAEKQANWHLLLDRWTSGFVEKYVAVSRAVADFSVQRGKLPKGKLCVISNGIDPAFFSNIQPVLEPQRRKRAIFVGRLHYQKGIDWLLETCKIWLAKLKDWELLLVGGGKPEDVERFHSLCTTLGEVKDRICFLGWRSDVPELLASSDLLLLPSRWEGMPNVVLQAMCRAMPVLATNVEGVRELFGCEEQGKEPGNEFLCESQCIPFGATELFCEKLLKIATDPDFAAELGRRNRQRILTAFDIRQKVDDYEKLWADLIRR